jgi:serine/threonine protein kinase
MDRYVIQKRIGDGTYGEVILATNKQSGEKVRNAPLTRPSIAGSLVLALEAAGGHFRAVGRPSKRSILAGAQGHACLAAPPNSPS